YLPGTRGPRRGVQAAFRGQDRLHAPARPGGGGRPRRVPLPARRVAHREPRGRHPRAQSDDPVRSASRTGTDAVAGWGGGPTVRPRTTLLNLWRLGSMDMGSDIS